MNYPGLKKMNKEKNKINNRQDFIDSTKDLLLSFGFVEKEKKFPVGYSNWQRHCSTKSNDIELSNWPRYSNEGFCVFTGKFCEIIDVDSKNHKGEQDFSFLFDEFLKSNFSQYDKLIRYKTQSGGLHYPYNSTSFENNQKLAVKNGNTLIETRGNNGLAVCPPTLGYEWLDGGEWEALPHLNTEEREELLTLCRTFDDNPLPSIPKHTVEKVLTEYIEDNPNKPGDDWAIKNNFIDYLKKKGWKISSNKDEAIYLTRPGKESGVSAVWNYKGLKRFYVFSSNTPLEQGKVLKPYHVLTIYDYNGNHKDCITSLIQNGYGISFTDLFNAIKESKSITEMYEKLKEYDYFVKYMDRTDFFDLKQQILGLNIKGVTDLKLDDFFRQIKIRSNKNEQWTKKLQYNTSNIVKTNLSNLQVILENDSKYKGRFSYNIFEYRSYIEEEKKERIEIEDLHFIKIRNDLGRNYGDFKEKDVINVIKELCDKNKFHPLQDKISKLEWDGTKRIEKFFYKYCGAEDSKYTALVSKKFFIGAIARLFKPGCKFDNMPIIEGAQGSMKSTMLKVLSYDHCLDGDIDINSKDGLMKFIGHWFIEFSELEGITGKKAETVKSFITTQNDKYRMPYERIDKTYPRSCIFIATTNCDHYLTDSTGNRRFWPIKTSTINIDEIIKDLDQLWSESFQLFKSGENHWVTQDEIKIFEKEQNKRLQSSEMYDSVKEYLITNHNEGKGHIKVTALEVWTGVYEENTSSFANTKNQREVANVLNALGLFKSNTNYKGKKQNCYKGIIKDYEEL